MRFAPILASLGGRPRQKPKPNLAKSSKIPPSPLKENQRKKLGFPWISLSELSPFNGLQRPLVAKISFPLLSSPRPLAIAALHSATGARYHEF
jgi:hypothetical protein